MFTNLTYLKYVITLYIHFNDNQSNYLRVQNMLNIFIYIKQISFNNISCK